MKEIAIYGAGGLGREVACLIRMINAESPTWKIIGFFDDGKEIGNEIPGFGPILGGINEVNKINQDLNIILSFGSPTTLKKIRERITNPNIKFPNIIAPDFFCADLNHFKIGEGNIITSRCSISTNITIGNFNLLNGNVGFGHDVRIGNYNVFMSDTRISGEVRIGNECLFGSGSFVKQEIKIPDCVTLGPLSPLLTNPKANSIYIGNPAKRFRF